MELASEDIGISEKKECLVWSGKGGWGEVQARKAVRIKFDPKEKMDVKKDFAKVGEQGCEYV